MQHNHALIICKRYVWPIWQENKFRPIKKSARNPGMFFTTIPVSPAEPNIMVSEHEFMNKYAILIVCTLSFITPQMGRSQLLIFLLLLLLLLC